MNKTICDLCKNEIKKDEKIFYFKLMDRAIQTKSLMKEICHKCADEIMVTVGVLQNED